MTHIEASYDAHIEALTYVTNSVYRQSSRSSMLVKLSRVVLWDMEQQYQDTMTLIWLSTPEVGSKNSDDIMADIFVAYTNNIMLCRSLLRHLVQSTNRFSRLATHATHPCLGG